MAPIPPRPSEETHHVSGVTTKLSKSTSALPVSQTLADIAALKAAHVDLSRLVPTTLATSPVSSPISSPVVNPILGAPDQRSKDAEMVASPVTAVSPAAAGDAAASLDVILQASYEFVKSARAALAVSREGRVEKEGEKMEVIRARLEEVVDGLEGWERR
ncbi:hypothetical protein FRB99_000723 [Tulasnella sp. 403]|nr:hypothetical protein FRB99_000723 [Tulasnella sp. 403]